MTEEEKSKCEKIIHSHVVLACVSSLQVPISRLEIIADRTIITQMAMSLSELFNVSIPENVVQKMIIDAIENTKIKDAMLKYPIKLLKKLFQFELDKLRFLTLSTIVPFKPEFGAYNFNVLILELTGWALAEELSNKRNEFKR